MKYVSSHPHELIFLDHLATSLGWDLEKVRHSINNLIYTKGMDGLERVRSGVYKYTPPDGKIRPVIEPETPLPPEPNIIPFEHKEAPSADKELFERIGQTQSGTPLVRGEDGTVYKLMKV